MQNTVIKNAVYLSDYACAMTIPIFLSLAGNATHARHPPIHLISNSMAKRVSQIHFHHASDKLAAQHSGSGGERSDF
jgi:hypothetical protein